MISQINYNTYLQSLAKLLSEFLSSLDRELEFAMLSETYGKRMILSLM